MGGQRVRRYLAGLACSKFSAHAPDSPVERHLTWHCPPPLFTTSRATSMKLAQHRRCRRQDQSATLEPRDVPMVTEILVQDSWPWGLTPCRGQSMGGLAETSWKARVE